MVRKCAAAPGPTRPARRGQPYSTPPRLPYKRLLREIRWQFDEAGYSPGPVDAALCSPTIAGMPDVLIGLRLGKRNALCPQPESLLRRSCRGGINGGFHAMTFGATTREIGKVSPPATRGTWHQDSASWPSPQTQNACLGGKCRNGLDSFKGRILNGAPRARILILLCQLHHRLRSVRRSHQAEACGDRPLASRAAKALTQCREADVPKLLDRLVKIDFPGGSTRPALSACRANHILPIPKE